MQSLLERRWIPPALMAACALLYVACAGCHGLWDPWETHYGEVARQMAERHDAISLYYPCSPLEGRWFWSKPVLTFWLMAPCLWLFGLQGAHARAGELADSWRAEWALRLPSIALALAGIWAIYVLVRRVAGARAAAYAAIVLATCPSWLLIGRQAMTDMPFVVPMTIALVLVGLAVLPDGADDRATPLARVGLYASVSIAGALPLLLISVQLRRPLVVLPYWLALSGALWWSARVDRRRAIYLMTAWVWCGVATLAKGPAGLALPALTIAAYLVASGRWRAIFTELELPRGLLLFVVVAFPWYHAMLVRHGMPFWRELIGDNYVHRALGRHGDRGTFEYYLQWLGYGTFPWSGLVLAALLRAFRAGSDDAPRARLLRLALCWLLVDYVVLALVRTKFHHYLLPMVPPLAIAAGVYLDELSARAPRLTLLLIAAPVTLWCGLDLAALPQRITWLFDYDYVNAPGIGRAWPSPAIYGDRYVYGRLIAAFACAGALGTAALALGRRWVLPLVALGWSVFIADVFIIALSPHWSQKHVIAAYYAQRRGPEEPLLVWTLFWHGENFYTANEIYRADDDRERTVFLGDRPEQRLQRYLAAHPARRVFFLVERVKIDALVSLLPPAMRATVVRVDDSNNKLVLLSALNPP